LWRIKSLSINKTYKCYNKAGTVYIFYNTVQSKLGSSRAMHASDVWIEKLAILSHEDAWQKMRLA